LQVGAVALGGAWVPDGVPAALASYTINESYNVVIRLNLLDEFEYRVWRRGRRVVIVLDLCSGGRESTAGLEPEVKKEYGCGREML
jgi:hypothetical protein